MHTNVAQKSEPISRRKPDAGPRGHTTWELAGSLQDNEEPAAHLDALLPLVEPRISARVGLMGAVADGHCPPAARWSR
jgi:hypothetical protein